MQFALLMGVFLLILLLLQPPPQVQYVLSPQLLNERSLDEGAHDWVKRTEGNGWKLWDRASILGADLNQECQWTDFRPAYANTVASARMCVYPRERDIYVTGSILGTGRWYDCDKLTQLILQHPRTNDVDSTGQKRKSIHVEIGANIGACVMQILLTTPDHVHVYAFEPHPQNLFYLTSTLMRLDEPSRDRVFLFPIALGAATGTSTLTMDHTNAGNARVDGGPINPASPATAGSVSNNQGKQIIAPIERLDDILNASNENPITLMKMDAQGFECFILPGMLHTMRYTYQLQFEVEYEQIKRFADKCSAHDLVQFVMDTNFTALEPYDAGHQGPLPDFRTFTGAINLLAKRTTVGV
jgi:FkbM family methyltransferase